MKIQHQVSDIQYLLSASCLFEGWHSGTFVSYEYKHNGKRTIYVNAKKSIFCREVPGTTVHIVKSVLSDRGAEGMGCAPHVNPLNTHAKNCCSTPEDDSFLPICYLTKFKI